MNKLKVHVETLHQMFSVLVHIFLISKVHNFVQISCRQFVNPQFQSFHEIPTKFSHFMKSLTELVISEND